MNPEIVLGPPGTGKTTTLLGIVEEELARGTAPEHIGFVSFTRRAAHEARDRAREKFGLDKDRFTWFRTLHSLCFRALGMTSGDVFEGEAVVEFADWIGVKVTSKRSRRSGEFGEEGMLFGNERGDRILQMENKARIRSMELRALYDEDDDDLSWWEVERVARGLAEFKAARSLHDYTDMLQIYVDTGWRPPLELLLVDEAQDLSMLQWRVVEKLAQGCRRVVVAGDDDQAIYNWAGAAVDYFVDLPGQVRVLHQSWRVPGSVQRIANNVIGQVRHRRPKEWAARAEDGTVRQVGMRDIDWSQPDILVLGRNSLFLEDVRRNIHASGYMYQRGDHRSISDKTRRILLAWEGLRKGRPQLVEDIVRVYELMSSGVGVARGYKELRTFQRDQLVTMQDLVSQGGLLRTDVWHDALDKMAVRDREYIRACLRRGEKMSEPPRIRLSTIHGSKGGEAREVVVLPDMAPRTHREADRDPDSEARVWYVAATRAMETLTVVRPMTERHFTFRRW
jgi:DNA helicase-2/ATP-dependent DNA helicase PcrA